MDVVVTVGNRVVTFGMLRSLGRLERSSLLGECATDASKEVWTTRQ